MTTKPEAKKQFFERSMNLNEALTIRKLYYRPQKKAIAGDSEIWMTATRTKPEAKKNLRKINELKRSLNYKEAILSTSKESACRRSETIPSLNDRNDNQIRS